MPDNITCSKCESEWWEERSVKQVARVSPDSRMQTPSSGQTYFRLVCADCGTEMPRHEGA